MALLEIEELTVEFGTEAAPFVAVDRVDLAIDSRCEQVGYRRQQ